MRACLLDIFGSVSHLAYFILFSGGWSFGRHRLHAVVVIVEEVVRKLERRAREVVRV